MLLTRYILNLLFPSECPVCGSPSDVHKYNPVCGKCWATIARYTGPSCAICGLPTVSDYTSLCAECVAGTPPFAKITCYGIYDGALKKSIHLLKFNKVKRLAVPLGALLAELVRDEFDAVVPVPLHVKRLREREFNQSALLGHHLAKSVHRPMLHDVLIKNHETSLQTSVSGKERRRNLKGAFSASKNIAGMRLLLVDDVITTGATAKECSSTLKQAGAGEIKVIALARSMPKMNT
jgi:ComF family protein